MNDEYGLNLERFASSINSNGLEVAPDTTICAPCARWMCPTMGVEKSAYRQPVTPQGLKAIEKGTLTWLDDDMYNNLNTGVLEQYLEEKNLEESFEVSHWNTSKVLYGIAIGAVFSGVTAYIGLKLGLAISYRASEARRKIAGKVKINPVEAWVAPVVAEVAMLTSEGDHLRAIPSK